MRARLPQLIVLAGAVASAVLGSGCSLRSIATRSLADALSSSGDSYGSDDDPELVQSAIPFALKTMEQVAEAEPTHVGVRLALASGFTQYAYAFVQQDADRIAEQDVARGKELETRARKLYLRARGYALDGLSIVHPGFRAAFESGADGDRARLLATCTKDDVPLLYWLGASWTLAIAAGKDHMDLVGQLPRVEPAMARALALDEAWDHGTLHEYFVAYDASRSEADGGGPKKAKEHLDRALALAENKRLGPIVSYAEGVLVQAQDKQEFVKRLEKIVATDVDSEPASRLANLIAKRRARWLLSRTAELFAD